MPLRASEMLLIIRTQDFASRNLERVAANLGRLSKFQSLSRKQAQLGIRQDKLIDRASTMDRELSLLRQRLSLESKLYQVGEDRRLMQERLTKLQASSAATGMIRGPGGRFVGQAGPAIAQLTTSLAALTNAEKDLKLESARVEQALRRIAPATAKMGFDQASLRAEKLAKELRFVHRELRIVQADLALTGQALKQAQFERIHTAGLAFSRFGRVMQLTGLITTGSLAAMGNAAANFSANATLAATQARDLGGDTAQVLARSGKLQTAINEQMQRFPIGADEMANAAYQIYSSLDLLNEDGVVNFSKGLKILELANKAAVAGGVSLDESIRGLIITLNNFDPQLEDVHGTLNTMFDIVRFGNIQFSDLTTVLSKVAPAAKSVGHTLEDVGGALAQATRNLPAGMVSAGFAQLEALFANRDFQEGVRILSRERLGESLDVTDAAGRLKDPLEILETLAAIFPEATTGGLQTTRMFKLLTSAGHESLTGLTTAGREFTIQQRRVFETLIQNIPMVRELQAAVEANKGELGKAFKIMMQDPGVQWRIFLNNMRALALEIGRMVLPYLLRLADWIQMMVDRFRALSPETKRWIAAIAVAVSVGTLLIGILSSIIGGIMGLIGSLGMIGSTVGPLLLIARVAGFLSGLGAIALILKVAWTGDATAKDFILGAMFGAAAGSIFGPGGAVLGAVIVPVVLQYLDQMPRTPFEKAAKDYQKFRESKLPRLLRWIKPPDWLAPPITPTIDKEKFRKQWSILMGVARKKLPLAPLVTAGKVDPEILKLFNKYKGQIKGLNDPTKKASGNFKEFWKNLTNKNAYKEFQNYLKTIPELENMFGRSGDAAAQRAKQLARAHEEAVQQATENMKNKVKQAVDNLMSEWDRIKAINQQALGSIFQGPVMSGILGNVFSGLNDTLRQFGIQIPVPFEILRKDMDMQLQYFQRWRRALNKLLARGAPLPFVQQLQEMGPEQGLSIAEGLLTGGEKGFKGIMNTWRKGQKLIRQATARDLRAQLAEWEKHGKQAAWAMINGLISTAGDLKIRRMFKKYVKDTFGGILQTEFENEVALAMKNAMATIAAQAEATKDALTAADKAGGTGGGRGRGLGTMKAPIPINPNVFTSDVFRRAALAQRQGERRGDAGTRQPAGTSNYYYDNVTVHADGATPDAVTRAFNKYQFGKKSRFRIY